MAAIQIDARKVQLGFMALQKPCPAPLPKVAQAPFPVMIIDRLPAQGPHAEERPHGQKVPLNAGLEVIEDSVDYLGQGDRGRKSPFVTQNKWHDLQFYHIFVDYTVH